MQENELGKSEEYFREFALNLICIVDYDIYKDCLIEDEDDLILGEIIKELKEFYKEYDCKK